jgi:hypothetical protein
MPLYLRETLRVLLHILFLVSPHLFLFVCSSTYFPGGMEITASLRRLVPENGTVIVEVRRADEHGSTTLKFMARVGQTPPGAE